MGEKPWIAMLKRLLIAEDHPVCAASVKLAAQEEDSTIMVESVVKMAELEAKLQEGAYDALVLDLNLEDSKGIVNIGIVRGMAPKMPILILSGMDSPGLQDSIRKMGGNGYLHKSANLEEIGHAISNILSGKTHFSAALDDEVDEGAETLAKLTRAQLLVMRELSTGSPNKIIAYRLGISEPTVKTHLSAIYRALGVHNRGEAIIRLQEINSAVMS